MAEEGAQTRSDSLQRLRRTAAIAGRCIDTAWHPSISSLAVALSLDVLTRCWYRPIGSAIPPRTRCDATPSGGDTVPRGLPKHLVAAGASSTRATHPRSCACYRVLPSPAAAHLACMRSASPEVSAPTALSNCRVHCDASPPRSRVYLARSVPSPGFRTLSTACSSTICPALFRAGALLEFLPLQSFSLVRSRSASRRSLCLLAIRCDSQQPFEPPSGLASPMWSGRRARWPRAWLQGFAPRYESVAKPSALTDDLPVALLGLRPLQGFLPRTCAGVLPHRLLPRASERRRVEAAAEATTTIYP